MIYLLDTNTCIGYISRRSLSVRSRLTSIPRQDVVLCDIVKLELYYGAYRSSRQERNLAGLRDFFSEFVSLPFDGQAAAICGQISPDLTVEIKSQSDRVQPLEEKILQFLALGTQVGMLIDPDKETVTIYYRDDRQPLVLGNGDAIALPELLPGWSVPVSELWFPVFD